MEKAGTPDVLEVEQIDTHNLLFRFPGGLHGARLFILYPWHGDDLGPVLDDLAEVDVQRVRFRSHDQYSVYGTHYTFRHTEVLVALDTIFRLKKEMEDAGLLRTDVPQ